MLKVLEDSENTTQPLVSTTRNTVTTSIINLSITTQKTQKRAVNTPKRNISLHVGEENSLQPNLTSSSGKCFID